MMPLRWGEEERGNWGGKYCPHVFRVTEASSTTAVCCIAGVFCWPESCVYLWPLAH